MTLTALWLQQVGYPAYVDRLLIDTVFQTQGVVNPGDLAVSQHAGGANMTVDVAAGVCAVAGTDVAGQQTYLNASDAVVNVAIAAAPGSGQSRIDLIVAHVQDVDATGTGTNGFTIVVVQGTAATTGSQVAPTIPASSLELASILVGPLVTSILTAAITNKRVYATSFTGSLFGVGPAITGTPPVSGAPGILIQAGQTFGSTDSGGLLHITWPVAFPNGLLCVIPSNGDSGIRNDIVCSTYQTGFPSTKTTGLIFCVTGSSASPLVSSSVTVDWIAIGF